MIQRVFICCFFHRSDAYAMSAMWWAYIGSDGYGWMATESSIIVITTRVGAIETASQSKISPCTWRRIIWTAVREMTIGRNGMRTTNWAYCESYYQPCMDTSKRLAPVAKFRFCWSRGLRSRSTNWSVYFVWISRREQQLVSSVQWLCVCARRWLNTLRVELCFMTHTSATLGSAIPTHRGCCLLTGKGTRWRVLGWVLDPAGRQHLRYSQGIYPGLIHTREMISAPSRPKHENLETRNLMLVRVYFAEFVLSFCNVNISMCIWPNLETALLIKVRKSSVDWKK